MHILSRTVAGSGITTLCVVCLNSIALENRSASSYGTVTNQNGRTFTLYLLPPISFAHVCDGNQCGGTREMFERYHSACTAAGLRLPLRSPLLSMLALSPDVASCVLVVHKHSSHPPPASWPDAPRGKPPLATECASAPSQSPPCQLPLDSQLMCSPATNARPRTGQLFPE